MKSDFSFLQDTFPAIANFGNLAEQYWYSDSNSCLTKLGLIGETIVNLIFNYNRILFPHDNTDVARIDPYYEKDRSSATSPYISCTPLRKAGGGKVAHANYASVEDGKMILRH